MANAGIVKAAEVVGKAVAKTVKSTAANTVKSTVVKTVKSPQEGAKILLTGIARKPGPQGVVNPSSSWPSSRSVNWW
jgi:hypothetical protein